MATKQQTDGQEVGIRGPELYEAGAIAIHIATQRPEALHRYAQGLSAVIKAWKLLAASRRLKSLYMERAFLIYQLEVLEARAPRAVAAALVRQRSVPTPAPDALGEPDLLHEALRSIEDELE